MFCVICHVVDNDTPVVHSTAKLEDQLSSEGEDENKKTVESEIKELNDLLPDIESKVSKLNVLSKYAEWANTVYFSNTCSSIVLSPSSPTLSFQSLTQGERTCWTRTLI